MQTKTKQRGLRSTRPRNAAGRRFLRPPVARQRGLTLLELLVTFVIVAMIAVVSLQLLNRTSSQTIRLEQELTQEAAVEHCMDLLVDDLAVAAAHGIQVQIRNHAVGPDRETTQLTIIAMLGTGRTSPSSTVEWVAMPRYEQDDLVLYRRRNPSRDGQAANYIPMCEQVYSFEARELTDNLIEVTCCLFRGEAQDPDRLFTVSRTFCLERFKF
ncbi:MAG: type II secretion system protein [Sedimentisphaerales bacterium]|nr:type II secretion system protein [Sedimentisphaerales bacterium]